MDKYAQKILYRDAGLPILNAVKFTAAEYRQNTKSTLNRIESALPYPVVVKPLNLGSSVGVGLANNRSELSSEIDLAAEFSAVVLAEQAVANLREINCAVLGDRDGAKPSECEEPISSDEILSYEDKYIAGSKSSASKGMSSLKRLLPAPLTPEQKSLVQHCAVQAFHALGCSGVARVDFLMDKNSGEIWVNEINTIPGSLAFYLWEASGVKYQQLLDELVALAFKRQREDANSNYTIETGILSNYTGGYKSAKN
jgi:D-alanine-D-alanine ligase